MNVVIRFLTAVAMFANAAGCAYHYYGDAPGAASPNTAEERASIPIPEADQYRVALHEAGHALMRAYLSSPAHVDSIAVFAKRTPDGTYGETGFVPFVGLQTMDDVRRIATYVLAGRAMSLLDQGITISGSGSDLMMANSVIWNAYMRTGLGGSLLLRNRDQVPAWMEYAVELDLNAAHACAMAVLGANLETLRILAGRIMALPLLDGKRTLSGDAFRAFLAEHPLRQPQADASNPVPAFCAPQSFQSLTVDQ